MGIKIFKENAILTSENEVGEDVQSLIYVFDFRIIEGQLQAICIDTIDGSITYHLATKIKMKLEG